MKSFAIIGLGLFGTQLAKELYNSGNNVLVIDSNDNIIEQIADDVSRAVCLDAKDRAALSNLGINKYDSVIVALSGDLATSVLITMNLKALNVKEIICKVQNDTDKEVLETLGATTCIIPEHIAATKLSKKLLGNHILDFTQLSDDHSIVEMTVPNSWINKSVTELNVRTTYRLNIIGIKNNNKIIVDFNPAEALKPSDILLIIGNNSSLEKLQKIR